MDSERVRHEGFGVSSAFDWALPESARGRLRFSWTSTAGRADVSLVAELLPAGGGPARPIGRATRRFAGGNRRGRVLRRGLEAPRSARRVAPAAAAGTRRDVLPLRPARGAARSEGGRGLPPDVRHDAARRYRALRLHRSLEPQPRRDLPRRVESRPRLRPGLLDDPLGRLPPDRTRPGRPGRLRRRAARHRPRHAHDRDGLSPGGLVHRGLHRQPDAPRRQRLRGGLHDLLHDAVRRSPRSRRRGERRRAARRSGSRPTGASPFSSFFS